MDRWADWLTRGRERGMTAGQRRRMTAALNRLRDGVLRGARLRPGQRVLDVGAGTGLIALGARRRVGPSGRVVALDISRDALVAAQRAARAGEAGPALEPVRADALDLPFADGSFDAVCTRSVLIYVEDKAAAVGELYRILRPGGRASIFEPINEVSKPNDWGGGRDLSAVQPEHNLITAHLLDASIFKDVMVGFDERDLVRWFADAGFSTVYLRYEQTYAHGPDRRSVATIAAALSARPNPGTPSYEEGARAVLAGDADEHLIRYVQALRSQPGTWISGGAYVWAIR